MDDYAVDKISGEEFLRQRDPKMRKKAGLGEKKGRCQGKGNKEELQAKEDEDNVIRV